MHVGCRPSPYAESPKPVSFSLLPQYHKYGAQKSHLSLARHLAYNQEEAPLSVAVYLIIKSTLPFYRQSRGLTGKRKFDAGSTSTRLLLCYSKLLVMLDGIALLNSERSVWGITLSS
jgi:hypothetical protein